MLWQVHLLLQKPSSRRTVTGALMDARQHAHVFVQDAHLLVMLRIVTIRVITPVKLLAQELVTEPALEDAAVILSTID